MKILNWNKLICVVLLALLLSASFSHATADTSPPKSRDGVVQINTGNALFNSQAPSLALAAELKKNQTDKRFRVMWSFGAGAAGSGNGIYTALYLRDASTLKLFGRYTDKTGRYYQNYFFTKVTDNILHQLAEKYQSGKSEDGAEDNDDMAYFTRVTEFGAQAKELSAETTN